MTNQTPRSLDLSVLAAMIAPAPRVGSASTAPISSRFIAADFEQRPRTGTVLIAGTLTP